MCVAARVPPEGVFPRRWRIPTAASNRPPPGGTDKTSAPATGHGHSPVVRYRNPNSLSFCDMVAGRTDPVSKHIRQHADGMTRPHIAERTQPGHSRSSHIQGSPYHVTERWRWCLVGTCRRCGGGICEAGILPGGLFWEVPGCSAMCWPLRGGGPRWRLWEKKSLPLPAWNDRLRRPFPGFFYSSFLRRRAKLGRLPRCCTHLCPIGNILAQRPNSHSDVASTNCVRPHRAAFRGAQTPGTRERYQHGGLTRSSGAEPRRAPKNYLAGSPSR